MQLGIISSRMYCVTSNAASTLEQLVISISCRGAVLFYSTECLFSEDEDNEMTILR